MSGDDALLRAAEEFEATARRHKLNDIARFGDLFEAWELAVSRMFGQSLHQLANQEELRLLREIHAAIVPRGKLR